VQSIPWGLSNLLGLKGELGLVSRIQDYAQPTIDVLDWIGDSQAREVITASAGVAAVGTAVIAALSPPSGESWWVRGCSARASVGAGELLRGQMIQADSVGSAIRAIGAEGTSSLQDAVGAGFCASYADRGFPMYSGDAIYYVVKKITTAGFITVNLSMTIYRFRA
jgi:hypothetical protein